MSQRISLKETLSKLPPEWSEDPLGAINQLLGERPNHKLIVLDDDPTGTQTVTNVTIITRWDIFSLVAELSSDAPGFFVLTNSRSLPEPESKALHHEIALNIRQALELSNTTATIISRSDSTLRGHYPLETDTIAEELKQPDLLILAPFFEAGGRYTINDVHYVTEGDTLIPAADTPFAEDKAFAYKNSNLPEWVEEKTKGEVPASSVECISLDQLRTEGPQSLSKYLLSLPKGTVCITNAASARDIEVLALATLLAEKEGRTISFRSAASIVAARLGQRPSSPLSARALIPEDSTTGGLTIVGSYVPKTSAQLKCLLSLDTIFKIELSVEDILSPSKTEETLHNAIEAINTALCIGKDVVLYTSRDLVSGPDASTSLGIGRMVSNALVRIASELTETPRYFIAKGGITSSDIATQGLGINRAIVQGQALPGVPVWKLGHETKFKGMNYIIFPGNVGTDESLATLVSELQRVERPAHI